MSEERTYDKLYLKITTIPNQLEDVDLESREMVVFNDKYKDYKDLKKRSDIETAYINESAVNGSFAKIYSVTLGFVHDNIPVVKTMYGEEKDLLDKLLGVLMSKSFSGAPVVMYNRAFILTFLSKRLRWHNYSISMLPLSLQVYDKKPWTVKGSKCIQDYVKGIGYQTENFAETCFIHHVDCNVIDGANVAWHIAKGEYDVIHQSDIRYVDALIQIDRQLSEESELMKVQSVIEEIGRVDMEPVKVFEHILASGQLSRPVIDALVEAAEERNVPKEDVLALAVAALANVRGGGEVPPEEYQELKEELGLVVDYKRIQCVEERGNLGKKEANILIKLYKDSEEKAEIVELTEQFLLEHNKMGQKRAKESFDYLKEQLS